MEPIYWLLIIILCFTVIFQIIMSPLFMNFLILHIPNILLRKILYLSIIFCPGSVFIWLLLHIIFFLIKTIKDELGRSEC